MMEELKNIYCITYRGGEVQGRTIKFVHSAFNYSSDAFKCNKSYILFNYQVDICIGATETQFENI